MPNIVTETIAPLANEGKNNVALNKSCTASSTDNIPGVDCRPELANDGFTITNGKPSFWQSARTGKREWWQVDLETPQKVEYVEIQFREDLDLASSRANFAILGSLDPNFKTFSALTAQYFPVEFKGVWRKGVTLSFYRYRYIRIIKLDTTQFNLAEVRVYVTGTPQPVPTPVPSPVPIPVPMPTPTPVPIPVPIPDELDTEEQAFLKIINDYRISQNLNPLKASKTLCKAAQYMSEDMSTKNYFSHNDSLGRDPFIRMKAFGYSYQTWLGENIAAGNSDAPNTFLQWKNSEGHRLNMVNPNYKVIGIGRASNPGSAYHYYWVTDFGGFEDQTF